MSAANNRPDGRFSEAVCIDAMRVFDSCSSQDCLEDVEFDFDNEDQDLINDAEYIKTQSIDVTDVDFSISPVAFNKGFYSVDVTYHFRAQIEVYNGENTPPVVVYGTADVKKKVILFGSDGGTQRFVSDSGLESVQEDQTTGCACCSSVCTLPTASVDIAAPMCLDTRLGKRRRHKHDDDRALGANDERCRDRNVYITIGIFAIISLSRPVPVMVPIYEYCVPGSECTSAVSGSPCEIFENIEFPTDEFFPKGLEEGAGCGCRGNNSSNNSGSENEEDENDRRHEHHRR